MQSKNLKFEIGIAILQLNPYQFTIMIKYLTFAITLIIVMFFIYNRFAYDKFASPKSLFSNEQEATDVPIACALTEPDLIDRKELLKEEIFSKVIESKETDYGYTFYFKDENNLLEKVTEFIMGEQKCCPFFSYNIKNNC